MAYAVGVFKSSRDSNVASSRGNTRILLQLSCMQMKIIQGANLLFLGLNSCITPTASIVVKMVGFLSVRDYYFPRSELRMCSKFSGSAMDLPQDFVPFENA